MVDALIFVFVLCLHIRYGIRSGSQSTPVPGLGQIHLRLQSLNCPLPATMPRVNYFKSALPVATRFLSVFWLLCGSCCFGQSVLTLFLRRRCLVGSFVEHFPGHRLSR